MMITKPNQIDVYMINMNNMQDKPNKISTIKCLINAKMILCSRNNSMLLLHICMRTDDNDCPLNELYDINLL